MKNSPSIQSIADGLMDGGCRFASNFPGFFTQDIFSALDGKAISVSEKIAYQEAYGASLAGRRSCVSFKNVGLNVAADAYLNSLLAGVHAGMVVIVTDDTEVEGSQSRQDSRHYRDIFGGLWLEPATVQSAYEMCYEAFDWSERFNLPIVIRLTNSLFEQTGKYNRQPMKSFSAKSENQHRKFIVHPKFWREQEAKLKANNAEIQKFAEQYATKHNKVKGFDSIACGSCQRELSGAGLENAMICETYPLPLNLITQEFHGRTELAVFEQGDDYAAKTISAALAETKTHVNSFTGHIPDHSADYRVWKGLEKFFLALKKLEPSYVSSDLTQFTVESTGIIDSCLCLGSAVSVGMGLASCGVDHPFCLTGDASLLHEGGISIIETAAKSGQPVPIVIFDNGGSWCTGGQPAAYSPDYGSIDGIDFYEINYAAASEKEIYDILSEMKASPKTSLLKVNCYGNQ